MNRREARRQFVVEHTALAPAALVSDIKLYLASEITPLWRASEAFLETHNVAPPFWAFAWPGSEALARHVTAEPGLVAGKRVLDFAAGCGLAGIACAQAGAAHVEAAEIDPMACAAMTLNAEANDSRLSVTEGDIVGQPCRWDVILCGDVCYEAPMTRHILPWLRRCAGSATVIIADPGRTYVPQRRHLGHCPIRGAHQPGSGGFHLPNRDLVATSVGGRQVRPVPGMFETCSGESIGVFFENSTGAAFWPGEQGAQKSTSNGRQSAFANIPGGVDPVRFGY